MNKDTLYKATDVLKKYEPKKIRPSYLYLFMADAKIKTSVMLARMTGISDEEIVKLIEPSVNEMICVYDQIKQKKRTQ